MDLGASHLVSDDQVLSLQDGMKHVPSGSLWGLRGGIPAPKLGCTSSGGMRASPFYSSAGLLRGLPGSPALGLSSQVSGGWDLQLKVRAQKVRGQQDPHEHDLHEDASANFEMRWELQSVLLLSNCCSKQTPAMFLLRVHTTAE